MCSATVILACEQVIRFSLHSVPINVLLPLRVSRFYVYQLHSTEITITDRVQTSGRKRHQRYLGYVWDYATVYDNTGLLF
jgi:hypothetical protein